MSEGPPSQGCGAGPLALSPCFRSHFLPHSCEPTGGHGCAAAAGNGAPAPAEPCQAVVSHAKPTELCRAGQGAGPPPDVPGQMLHGTQQHFPGSAGLWHGVYHPPHPILTPSSHSVTHSLTTPSLSVSGCQGDSVAGTSGRGREGGTPQLWFRGMTPMFPVFFPLPSPVWGGCGDAQPRVLGACKQLLQHPWDYPHVRTTSSHPEQSSQTAWLDALGHYGTPSPTPSPHPILGWSQLCPMLVSAPCALLGWPAGLEGTRERTRGTGVMLGHGSMLPSLPVGITTSYCPSCGITGFLGTAVFSLPKRFSPPVKTTLSLLWCLGLAEP